MSKPTQTVSIETLSKVLMLTDRRVQQLVKEGVLYKEGRGRYPLIPNVQAYIKYWQDRSVGSDAEGTDFSTENTRVKKLTADKLQLEIDTLRGDLVPSYQVLEMLEHVIANARAKLLTLPIKAAQVAIHATDLKDIEREIQLLVYESLRELDDQKRDISESPESMGSATTLNS